MYSNKNGHGCTVEICGALYLRLVLVVHLRNF